MRRNWARQRARLFAEATPEVAAAPAAPSRRLVGRDFAGTRAAAPRARAQRWLLPALVGTVLAALLLASLRTAIQRTSYQLGATLREESTLLERHRSLAVELRELRDPVRLHQLARDSGLARPELVIDLPMRETRP